MTAFLTIAGIDLEILENGAAELEPLQVRAYDDTLLSERRQFGATPVHMTQAAYNTLRAAVNGGPVTCGGPGLDATPRLFSVRIGTVPFVYGDATTVYRLPPLTLTEA